MFFRLLSSRGCLGVAASVLLATGTVQAWDFPYPSPSNYRDVGPRSFSPGYYGYDLDDRHPGYFGGGRYREYYSYGGTYGYPGLGLYYPYRAAKEYNRRPSQPPGPLTLPPGYVPTSELFPEFRRPPEPAERPVRFTVRVPAGAEVWIEGTKMSQEGTGREFVSPPLTPGEKYSYEIRARWTEDGKAVDQTQTVIVQAGERPLVTFPTAP